MKAERLLRLYPRVWRERYGAELLEIAGPGPLHLREIVDIASGALDAWLSRDVRRATGACQAGAREGGHMVLKSIAACGRRETRVTTRDSRLGAIVMLAVALVLTLLGAAARRNGWPGAAEMLTSIAFFVALTLSMPFWLLKGQPWKAQVAIVGGTTVGLLVIGYVATII